MRRAVILWTLTAALLLAAASRSHAGPALLRALRYGDKGPQVAALQEQLHAAGFDPGGVDGVFGPRTEAAVRAAQAAMGVTVDGLAGTVTMQGLQRAPQPEKVHLVVHAATATVTPFVEPTPAEKVEEAKQFGLTFNGVPDPALLPQLLRMLADHKINATFFLLGETAEQEPDLVAQIAAAGHEVATQGYADLDMTQISEQMQTAQLRRAVQAIKRVAGSAPLFFRPPQGRFNAGLWSTAEAEGLRPVLWTNVNMTGSADTTPQRLSESLLRSVYPGAILMLHQDRASSLAALERILPKLRAEGYQGVALSRLLPNQAPKAR